VFWWVVAVDRPTWAGDYAAMIGLLLLLVLGAVALSWPWLSEEVPRAVAAGLAAGTAWVRWLVAVLTRLG
jgi:hypothetical protein